MQKLWRWLYTLCLIFLCGALFISVYIFRLRIDGTDRGNLLSLMAIIVMFVAALIQIAPRIEADEHFFRKRYISKLIGNPEHGESGNPMAWDVNLNPVVTALSIHITSIDEIRIIGEASKLSMNFVALYPKPYLSWHEIFNRALDETKVLSVLDKCLEHTQHNEVREAIAIYKSIE